MIRRLASLTCLLALACTPTAEISDPPSSTTTTEQPSSTTAAQPSSTTDEPSTDDTTDAAVVQLSQLETTITVATGTELRYSYKSHASVGYGAKFEIGDPSVLEHVRSDKEYKQSEAEREGKDGADAATGIFVFKASTPGTTTLKVIESLRGKTQLEVEYAITVVAP